MFDDNFETVESLRKGVEPQRWKWLATHKREYHLDDNGKILDGTKVWTDTELESSILFEVPKEKNLEEVDAPSQDNNSQDTPLSDVTRNNNKQNITNNE